jgi:hypothetical protein
MAAVQKFCVAFSLTSGLLELDHNTPTNYAWDMDCVLRITNMVTMQKLWYHIWKIFRVIADRFNVEIAHYNFFQKYDNSSSGHDIPWTVIALCNVCKVPISRLTNKSYLSGIWRAHEPGHQLQCAVENSAQCTKAIFAAGCNRHIEFCCWIVCLLLFAQHTEHAVSMSKLPEQSHWH